MAFRKIRGNRKKATGSGGTDNGKAGTDLGENPRDIPADASTAAEGIDGNGENSGVFTSGELADFERSSQPVELPEPAPKPKRKWTRRAKQPVSMDTPQNLTKLLLGLHEMGAKFLAIPELELSEPEAAKLGLAVAEVNALYSKDWISPEVTAWTNLVVALGVTYYPRYLLYRIRVNGQQPTPINQPRTADVILEPHRPGMESVEESPRPNA